MSDDPMPKSVIERVDTFIRRFQDLDVMSKPIHDSDRELSHTLAGYLSDYLALPANSPFKEGLASLCEVWINRALAAGIIKDGEGLLRQLRRTNLEREKLLEENQRLTVEVNALKADLAALRSGSMTAPVPKTSDDTR